MNLGDFAGARRALINFDISSIPASNWATAATLTLYIGSAAGSATSHQFNRITQTGWVEAQVTWNDYSTGNAWASAGGDFTTTDNDTFNCATATGDQAISIPNTVRDAILSRSGDLHLLLKAATEDGGTNDPVWSCRSSDHGTAGDRPELVVTYRPRFFSPMPTLDGLGGAGFFGGRMA